MRLRRLELRRLPGIDEAFALERLEPGLVLVVGPNGSGKTSLCRAVQWTLWPETGAPDGAEATSVWAEEQGAERRARLRGGRVAWEREGEPAARPELPDRHLAACFTLGLRELLADDGESDRALADRVRVQMAGGYDLAACAGAFETRRGFGSRERRALEEARDDRARIEGERRRLAGEEDRLAELEREQESARAAREEAARLEKAAALARAREERARAEARLAEFPPAVAKLRGGEAEELARLDEDADELRRKAAACDETRARAERRLREVGAPEEPPDRDARARLAAGVRALETRARERAEAERQAAEARSGLDEAAGALGEELRGEARALDAELVADLESLATREIGLAEAEARARARAGEEESEETGAEAEPGPDSLRRAAEALRDWLAAPRPASSRLAFALSAALLAGGALALSWGAPALFRGAGFALLGAGLAGLVAAALRARAGRGARAAARQAFAATRMEPPAAWSPAAARARLAALDEALARAARAELERARAADERRALGEIERERKALEARRAALAERAGLRALPQGLRLADLAARLRVLREAAAREARARGSLEHARTREAESLERVAGGLAPLLGSAPRDAEEARSLFDALERRLEAFDAAEAERRAARAEGDARREELRKVVGRQESILHAAGLEGPLPEMRRELESLLGRLEAWREAREALGEAERRVAEGEAALAERPELAALDAETAERRREEAEAEAETLSRTAEWIGEIRARLQAARESRALEEALAAESAAEEALAERREEWLRAAAGRFLLARVAAEHERAAQPAVLERARALFGAFTHHRYELEVDAREGAPTRFRAADASRRERLALSQLSDGTRVQLLLAARLAFATHAERGERLPLFLDESLTTADPDRFHAVAESLLPIAAGGRQIFYLTADPQDVALWRAVCRERGAPEPQVVELGELRKLARSARAGAALAPPARRRVPEPDAAAPEAWARAVGVPAPDPHAPAEALHWYHLLAGDPEDLALCHRLLDRCGVETVGQWRQLVRAGAERSILDTGECERLEALARLAEATLEAWRVGRGRPVTREDLARCKAVSERFLDGLAALADEEAGDARRLLERLEARRDERVKGFQARKVDELRAWLEEREHLDPQPPLPRETVHRHALAAAEEALRRGTLHPAELRRRVEHLLAALGG